MQTASQPSEDALGLGTKSQRLIALDAFRGLTMALMVLVNNAGSNAAYAPLKHAEWHGWTLTDTVFPSFLWIVGVAITLSLAKRRNAGHPSGHLVTRIIRRAAVLFILGLTIYAFPFNADTQRILGVLQRIAICYLIGSLLYLYTSLRTQVIVLSTLFAAYWLMMGLAPVPGYGAGHLDVENNFAHYVDRIVLGSHNYHWTKTWDPEGIISTLPAIGTTILGMIAGHILAAREALYERTTKLFATGTLLLVAGLICDTWLPINKKLWTVSFSLFMAGIDYLALALLIWIIDARGWRRPFQPFVIFGMNAIAIYLAAEYLDTLLHAMHWQHPIFATVFAPLASPANASLLYSLMYVLVMYAVAYVMYRKNWFLRV